MSPAKATGSFFPPGKFTSVSADAETQDGSVPVAVLRTLAQT